MKQYKDSDYHDLHFTVNFKDGSVWSDHFKRCTKYNHRRDEYLPTNKFKNDFMPGDDEMTQSTIKRRLSLWIGEKNPDSPRFKIVWSRA
jgi:hypothetical protein